MRKNSNRLLTLTEFDRSVKDMIDGKIKITPQVGELKAQG
jgi:hypothetical protein